MGSSDGSSSPGGPIGSTSTGYEQGTDRECPGGKAFLRRLELVLDPAISLRPDTERLRRPLLGNRRQRLDRVGVRRLRVDNEHSNELLRAGAHLFLAVLPPRDRFRGNADDLGEIDARITQVLSQEPDLVFGEAGRLPNYCRGQRPVKLFDTRNDDLVVSTLRATPHFNAPERDVRQPAGRVPVVLALRRQLSAALDARHRFSLHAVTTTTSDAERNTITTTIRKVRTR